MSVCLCVQSVLCCAVLESLLNLIWINIDKLIIINSDYVHIFQALFVVRPLDAQSDVFSACSLVQLKL